MTARSKRCAFFHLSLSSGACCALSVCVRTSSQVQQRGLLMLSESGIFTPKDVAFTKECGCGGILVGESLVKQPDTTVAVKELLA